MKLSNILLILLALLVITFIVLIIVYLTGCAPLPIQYANKLSYLC